MRLNKNDDNFYFNNAFNLKGNWNNDSGSGNTKSIGMDETIYQHLNKPSFVVDNTLNIIKNIRDNSYNVHFSAGYASSPHSLSVTPASYNPVGEGNLPSITQNADTKEFASILRTTYFLRLSNFILEYSLWQEAKINNLNTSLGSSPQTERDISDSLKNNLFYNNYQTGFQQSYTYKNGKFKSNITLPLIYSILSIDDRIPNKTSKNNKLIFRPSASVSYDLTPEFIVSARANYANSFGDMSSSYTGYIMHGYRSLLRNTVDRLYETRSGGGNIYFGYRNTFRALFVNAGVNYNRSWKNLLYGYNYQGILSVKTTIDQPTEYEDYGASFGVSKGLSFWSATIGANGGYSEGHGEQLIQNDILSYHSQSYRAMSSINMIPFSFILFNYSFSWNRNKSFTVERPEHFPPITGISQNLRISIFITKTLTINIGAEHQYNSAINDGNRYTTFADAGVKFKRKQLELELEFNNIFNSKQYVAASYSEISTYYYSYNLRPASVLLRARFKLK
jgi:hypothetical protein